jgi:hypothetical protein
MANQGKTLQIGGGSRRPSQAKAEDAARRSRKMAAQGRALLAELEEGLGWSEPARDPVMDAMALLHVAAWEFGNALASLTPKVAYPDDNFQTVYQIGDER